MSDHNKKVEKKVVDVTIGPSKARTRRVFFPGISKVDATPVNPQQPGWVDKFSVTVVKGEYFDITRIDHDAGWGQPLVLRCKARGDKYTVASDEERKAHEEKKVAKWESLGAAGTSIGTDAQGNLIASNATHQISQRARDAKAWTAVDGFAVLVARGADGATWCLNSKGVLYYQDGGVWKQMPGNATSIAVGSASQAVCINKDGKIFRWLAGKHDWEVLEGAAVSASIASDGTLYVINKDRQIFRKAPTGLGFVPVSGKANDIAVIAKNLVFAIDSGKLLKSVDEGATWVAQEGSLKFIAGAPGHLVGVGMDDQLCHLLL